ncbi:MAG: cell division protein ZapA [Pseudomonadota bacterium]
MGQISIALNGRQFRLACGDGEEPRAERLGDHIRRKVDQLARQHGATGDDRLLLMAAMMTADELFEAREALGAARTEIAHLQTLIPPAPAPDGDHDGASEGDGAGGGPPAHERTTLAPDTDPAVDDASVHRVADEPVGAS